MGPGGPKVTSRSILRTLQKGSEMFTTRQPTQTQRPRNGFLKAKVSGALWMIPWMFGFLLWKQEWRSERHEEHFWTSDEMKSAKEFPVSLDTLITLCIQII